MKEIKVINGVPSFVIDNEIIQPIAYMTYISKNADYKAFADNGFSLYSIGLKLSEFSANELMKLKDGFSPQTWLDENKYDFSSLDDDVEKLIRDTRNKDVKIILRINLNMPNWWRKKYPNELTLYDNGKTLMQSISSRKWREDCSVFLDALKNHIDEKGYNRNIIAWQPSAMQTEEWFAPVSADGIEDFSKPAINAFREYCKNKYGTVSKLNDVWQSEYKCFEEIHIPTKDERVNCNEFVNDYFRQKNNAYAETVEYFCAYIKKIFAGDIFVGCFGGYVGQLMKNYGHCAFSKLLKSKNIDFFASPFAYTSYRGKAVDWIYHSAIETTRRAGKLWFIEADVRTDLTKSLRESASWLFDCKVSYYEDNPVWFGPDRENSLWNMIRSFSKMFISRNAFWWFDMWGGWYADKDFSLLIKKTFDLYVREIYNTNNNSEVAVILDEEASFDVSNELYYSAVYNQIVSLGYLGTPYDLLLLQSIKEDDLLKYKTVIFLAPSKKKTNIDFIEKLKHSGKTVLVSGDDKGLFNGEKEKYSEEELLNRVMSSGVHIYSANNIVYANNKFISVTARNSGELTITMPTDCSLYDCINGNTYLTTNKQVILKVKENQSFLFEIKK